MGPIEWEVADESGNPVYTSGMFKIEKKPAGQGVLGARPYWEATHHGQRIKTSQDLVEIMDYCAKVDTRLA